jgi:hypothetical protein
MDFISCINFSRKKWKMKTKFKKETWAGKGAVSFLKKYIRFDLVSIVLEFGAR